MLVATVDRERERVSKNTVIFAGDCLRAGDSEQDKITPSGADSCDGSAHAIKPFNFFF